MKILIINAGSSSLKYELFVRSRASSNGLKSVAEGYIERIGQRGQIKNHLAAVEQALNTLIHKKLLKNLGEIRAVGHRVVHGGEKYQKPARITSTVQKEITRLCKLAPLHNPPNLEGIKACKKLLPGAVQVAVFDTAFHQTLPPKAFLYALPYKLYEGEHIRRYGFHGTSHAHIAKEVSRLMKKKQLKIVTCHLGNGSSITAVHNGKSIDTSMGFTPLEGVPMGTRSGNIDPAIALKLAQSRSLQEVDDLLNHKSGFKGISGLSSDMRDLLKTRRTRKRSQLAIDIFTYRVAQYIAAYSASLKGLDAIAFTGGIGENSGYIRAEICSYLGYLGVTIDPAKNRANKTIISRNSSKVKLFAIPADEEKEIATATLKFL